jgi:hypothetical protein
MMKVALVAFLLSAGLVAGAGCGGGGSGDKTFEGDGYSFTYPSDWEEWEVGEVNPGAALTTAFGPEEAEGALVFEVGDAGTPITDSNIDTAAEELAGALQESTEGPIQLSVAGLPALRIVSHPRSGLTRRITTVFDGTTMYIFDCELTPPHVEEMKRGCDQVEESFEVE